MDKNSLSLPPLSFQLNTAKRDEKLLAKFFFLNVKKKQFNFEVKQSDGVCRALNMDSLVVKLCSSFKVIFRHKENILFKKVVG